MHQGEKPIDSDPTLGHAGNFVYMLFGRAPRPIEARFLDIAMILMADHGLNASTFAARVTASTLADMYAAFTTAVGTLNGPLHGAANAEAMKMLLEIESEDKVEGYIRSQLLAGKRIMGFGHRVYKTGDPRADLLRDIFRRSKAICRRRAGVRWLSMSKIRRTNKRASTPTLTFTARRRSIVSAFPWKCSRRSLPAAALWAGCAYHGAV